MPLCCGVVEVDVPCHDCACSGKRGRRIITTGSGGARVAWRWYIYGGCACTVPGATPIFTAAGGCDEQHQRQHNHHTCTAHCYCQQGQSKGKEGKEEALSWQNTLASDERGV